MMAHYDKRLFEDSPEEHELADVIRVVIDEEQSLTINGGITGVRERSEKVIGWIFNHFAQLDLVCLKRRDALVPRFGVRRFGCRRPIIIRELQRRVVGASRVFDNIVLRDTKVLEQLPRGVRRACGPHATQFWREPRNRVVEGRVGVAAVQKVDELFPNVILIHFRIAFGIR